MQENRKNIMRSIITSKFQTTIPKAVRENLKLSVKDALEWKIVRGNGDIAEDIKRARNLRAEKYRIILLA